MRPKHSTHLLLLQSPCAGLLPPHHILPSLKLGPPLLSPDDLDEFTHVNVVRHQELGLVQNRELLFSYVSLDDHLQWKDGGEGRGMGTTKRSR